MRKALDKISILKNPVREYAWGSKTAIQDLVGRPELAGKPVAELWMGAHPNAPSSVLINGKWKSLDKVIEADPECILGKHVAGNFDNKLPFLFKVLAADTPLSIQVHPNLEQAREGFARENGLGIPINAPNRNYRDENHKPEILCAITEFHALKGFRKIEEILGLMGELAGSNLSNELGALSREPDSSGLRCFFTALMAMDRSRQQRIVSDAVRFAEDRAEKDETFDWMVRLNRKYPSDIGVFSPVILNLVHLEPEQAIYLHAGELHAYLHGVGVELMANSDNVLRGGLTPKHIDVHELLKIVDFTDEPVRIIRPVMRGTTEVVFVAPAREFRLSMISIEEGTYFASQRERGPEILICIEGEAQVKDLRSGEILHLRKGKSIVVPSAVYQYQIHGSATFYKATVPMETGMVN